MRWVFTQQTTYDRISGAQISLADLDALYAEGSRLPVEVPELLVRLRMLGFGSVTH